MSQTAVIRVLTEADVKALHDVEEGVAGINRKLDELTAKSKKASSSFQDSMLSLSRLGSNIRQIGQGMMAAGVMLMGASAPAVKFAKDGVEIASTWQQTGAALRAVTSEAEGGAAAVEASGQRILAASKKTTFGANEYRFAQLMLKESGFDLRSSEIAVAAGANLTTAAFDGSERTAEAFKNTVMDLAQATRMYNGDIFTAAEKSGNYSQVTMQMNKNADVFTAILNTSSARMGDFIQGFNYLAPVAKTLNISLADTGKTIGILSDAGIDGSRGGREVASALIAMSKPTAETKTLMQELGISLFDAKGNFKGMEQVSKDLNQVLIQGIPLNKNAGVAVQSLGEKAVQASEKATIAQGKFRESQLLNIEKMKQFESLATGKTQPKKGQAVPKVTAEELAAYKQAIGAISGTSAEVEKNTLALIKNDAVFSKLTPEMRKQVTQMATLSTATDKTQKDYNKLTSATSNLVLVNGKLSEAEKTRVAAQLFGQAGMRGMLPLISNGTDSWEKYNKAVDSTMTAEDIAAKKLDNFKDSLAILQSTMQAAMINTFIPIIDKFLTPLVKKLTAAVEWFDKLPQPVKEAAIGLGLAGAAIGGIVFAIGMVLFPIGMLMQGLAGIGLQFSVLKLSTVGLLTQFGLVSAVFLTLGAIVSGVVLAFQKAPEKMGVLQGIFDQMVLDGKRLINFFVVEIPKMVKSVETFLVSLGVAFSENLDMVGINKNISWVTTSLIEFGKYISGIMQGSATGNGSGIGKFFADVVNLANLAVTFFRENWPTIQIVVGSVFTALGSLFNNLWVSIQIFLANLDKALAKFGGLEQTIKSVAIIALAVIGAIVVGFFYLLTAVVAVVDGIVAALPYIGDVIGGVVTLVSGLLTVILAPFKAILRIGQAIIDFFLALDQPFKRFMQGAGNISEVIDVFIMLRNSIIQIFTDMFGEMFTGVTQIWTGIVVALQGVLNSLIVLAHTFLKDMAMAFGLTDIAALLQKIMEDAIVFFTNAKESVVGIIASLAEAVRGWFYQLYMWLIGGSIIPDIVNGIIAWLSTLKSMWDNIWNNLALGAQLAMDTFQLYVNGFIAVFSAVWNTFWLGVQIIVDSVLNMIIGYVAFFAAMLTGNFEGMQTALQSIWDAFWGMLPDSARTMLDNVITAIAEKAIEFVSAGENIMNSLRDGIISAAQGVIDAVTSAVSSALESAKSAIFGGGSQTVNVGGIPGRAQGGSVTGGGAYVVGERGPELFTPGKSGKITPNNKMAGAMNQIGTTAKPPSMTTGGGAGMMADVVGDTEKAMARFNNVIQVGLEAAKQQFAQFTTAVSTMLNSMTSTMASGSASSGGLTSMVSTMQTQLTAAVPILQTSTLAISAAWSLFTTGIAQAWNNAWTNITLSIGLMTENIDVGMQVFYTNFTLATQTTLDNIVAAWVNTLNRLNAMIFKSVAAMIETIRSNYENFYNSGVGLMERLGAGVVDTSQSVIDDVVNAVRSAVNAANIEIAKINSSGGSSKPPDGRASGGRVFGNTPYIVGEKGPELYTPGANGSIVSTKRLYGALGALMQSDGTHNSKSTVYNLTYNATVSQAEDPNTIRHMLEMMEMQSRLNGA